MVEFAAIIPFMLLLFIGLTEMGRAFVQANAVEKAMRAAAVYAARVENPTALDTVAVIENLVKTGTADGTGHYLVSGWAQESSRLDIAQSYFDLGEASIPVIRLTASVPFNPMIPELATMVGLDDFNIVLSHEQAYVDN
ncbi:TadE family protein [Terasakiella sp. SH-1]|uniref:TadE family protein n=1 Tax=Terasakiella sp. SH-1 TaxID=2560057 RepID=UPI001430655C|nr:TadE family protein [Terasakiella sp. SH-1]